MLQTSQNLKSERIDQVVAHLKARVGRAGLADAERFVRLYYRRVAASDLADGVIENLYGAALSLWQFSESRKPGTAKVRVFNPRVEEQGWRSPHTIVEIVTDDMPFLVDSVTANLTQNGHPVHLVIHPVCHVRRDGRGKRLSIVEDADKRREAVAESVMHIEIGAQSAKTVVDGIRAALEGVLADVRNAVQDWRTMLVKVEETVGELTQNPAPAGREETEETIAFLRWLADNHFTFLGYREYTHRVSGRSQTHTAVAESGLGIMRGTGKEILESRGGLGAISEEVRNFLGLPEPVIVTKANVRSTVHRPVHLDYIGVKRFDSRGKVVGERRFVGLFTSTAYSQPPEQIPFLRRKVRRTVERSGLAPASHDGKALTNILDTFPRNELFQMSEDELFEMSMGILELQERPRISAFYRRDPFGRFVACLAYVPRERHTTELLERMGETIAHAFDGYVSNFFVTVGDSPLARTLYIIGTKGTERPDPGREELEDRLRVIARTWSEDLHDELVDRWGEERGNALWHRYGKAFPAGYAEVFSPQEAVFDIARMEESLDSRLIAMNLYRAIEAPEESLRFKLFSASEPLPLSDTLPMLENMGFRVIDEHPYEVTPVGSDTAVWVHDFGLLVPAGTTLDLDAVKEKYQEAFSRVWYGDMDNDGFNRLVIRAGLAWREIVVLRAYCKYLRQTGIPFSQAYMENTLAAHPAVARTLVDLFVTRFDVANRSGVDRRATELVERIRASLDAVSNLDEDRILRRFLNLIQSTLRTNFFQPDGSGATKPYVAFKLDSRAVEELPLPRPLVETFVYSARAEAIHLRGGKVARGGIRWSDRPEDFRTEVLGLMKAQMVKNAVIVPVGAKGGFICKRLPADGTREAVQAEVVACYKTLISGLLDLVDNIVGGKIVPPKNVIRYDEDDPYLVVAADKGTATFSDIANGVAIEYGFWLGDAFASGGSAGYDHKGMGITARGGWESVKRHFREIGVDTQSEDFSVVGVGDMSGDVFGNGMLLSKHIRLVGAFNHLHIFIDPDPDPSATFEERKRLFALPRSAWTDFDAKLISKGGGVFDRKAKSITLSPEIKRVFGIRADQVTPSDLIRTMLKAEVDLLWFGGIGTYVKAASENNLDVGDRANDSLRINGREIRAKVVGEGANLGVTQRGRIEAGLAGVRLNTDAIDNSAGVDCSDHEVNIKVLLNALVADGEMTEKQRLRLLSAMTDEVADLVLRNNYLQTLAITTIQARGHAQLDAQTRFMRATERAGRLDRTVEYLPDDEALADRQAQGGSLTRSEVAVLLAYSKMTLYDALLESDVPEDGYFSGDLAAYFPSQIQKKYPEAIERHSLRREIVATQIANSMVNRAGITFVNDIAEDTGIEPAHIARAYVVTRDAFDLRGLWSGVAELDNKVPASVQTGMMSTVEDLIGNLSMWFLKNLPQPMDIASVVRDYAGSAAQAIKSLETLLAELDVAALRGRQETLVGQGVPKDLAGRFAALPVMRSVCHVVHASNATRKSVESVGRIYFALGARLGLDWLRSAAERIEPRNHWERLAVSAIIEDLYGQQRGLASRVIQKGGKLDDGAIGKWVEANKASVERTSSLIDEFRLSGTVDLAQLAIVNRHVRSMLVS